ncbi:MAG TPA: GNAT family protein [Ktedonobacterales bacterium]|nr:GNAT family protein [Ktedonobacterales bacterium]
MGAPRYLTLIPLFDELRGERVVVRPYHPEDAAELQAAVAESRDHLRPWLPFADQHQRIEESRDFIIRVTADWLLREDMAVALLDATTGRFVGGAGLHPRDWDVRVFEIGYWVRATAQGHGYVTEAVRLLTDFAFDHLAANRVYIRCNARNARSAAVAERLGFAREALLRNEMRAVDGSLRDTLIYALIPGDLRWPQ